MRELHITFESIIKSIANGCVPDNFTYKVSEDGLTAKIIDVELVKPSKAPEELCKSSLTEPQCVKILIDFLTEEIKNQKRFIFQPWY